MIDLFTGEEKDDIISESFSKCKDYFQKNSTFFQFTPRRSENRAYLLS